MAKVLTSPLITDVRQKIGGVVFQATAGGLAVRTQKAKSKTAPTATQNTKANYLTALSAWQTTLGPTDRNAWAIFASAHPQSDVFGNPFFLSGFDIFMKYNIPALGAAGSIQISPPSSISVTTPSSFAASAVSGTQTLQIDSLSNNPVTGETMVVNCQGRIYPWRGASKVRLSALSKHAAPLSFPVDLSIDYISKFGALVPGLAIALQLYVVSSLSGAKCPTLYLTVISS